MVTVKIMSGQTLGQALKEQGYEVERPCGGNGLCKGCQVYVDGIGMVKSCQFAEEGSYLVEIPKKHLFDAVGEMLGAGMESGNLDKDADKDVDKDADLDRDTRIYAVQRKDWDANPVAAVDIGTTTVVLKLSYRGRMYETGFVNPQRAFGADVMSRIQAANGGIRVDTLFIDEGFGALDSESLDQACETLLGLVEHDRLIGIISHVPELRERIDSQIVVDKTNSGSSIEIHV